MRTMAIFATLLLSTVAFPMVSSENVCSTVEILEFDGNLANESVTTQVDFGPRVPGSNASMELRNWFMETRPGFDWRLDPHSREGYNLTNLEGKLIPSDAEDAGPVVVLAAHYDSSDRAERDPDENMTNVPIPGANDGGSGVAVLWELARILPTMNLNHEVWILLTDAEDQGPTPSMLGAKAWAENRTDEDISRIDAFLLVGQLGGQLEVRLNPLGQRNGCIAGDRPQFGKGPAILRLHPCTQGNEASQQTRGQHRETSGSHHGRSQKYALGFAFAMTEDMQGLLPSKFPLHLRSLLGKKPTL